MTAMLGGDIAKMASIAGLDPKQLQENFPGLARKFNGEWKDFELLGSVGRRNGDYHIVPVRLKSGKSDVLKLIIWHEEGLFDIRPSPQGNTKNFDHMKGNEFFSDANHRSIVFDEVESKPVLRIKAEGKEIIARKQ